MDRIIRKNQKELRCGLTTGTCAAACGKAAMLNLLTGQVPEAVNITLPGGDTVSLKVSKCDSDKPDLSQNGSIRKQDGIVYSEFFTLKDAGDDPDVTNGTEIHVRIEEVAPEDVPLHAFKFESGPSNFVGGSDTSSDESGPNLTHGSVKESDKGLFLAGGKGVGVVTKPGLHQNIGESAINPVPREMIFRAVRDVLESTGNEDHREIFLITVIVPDGEELAKKTFNPMLGIEGGISILGTTGIVEPMSEASIVATIETEIRQKMFFQREKNNQKDETEKDSREEMSYVSDVENTVINIGDNGNREMPENNGNFQTKTSGIIAVPGNYGKRYAEELGLDPDRCVTVSNYIGEAIDLAIAYGCGSFLLIGNVGKLVKLAAGIMNTHSKVADGRWEIFAAHLALCGGTREQVRAMREAATTEEMLTRLNEMGLREEVMASIMKEVEFHMEHRIKGKMKFGVIVYSERFGIVGKCGEADRLLKKFEGRIV
ncbi:cobalt-precorrin-5B (C(1))-methyltransferase CbiD [Oribacterium sp. P6A1]|uniref:cobalt-precorrin-5B (C(1))-methyltransferase CbiD n=1 Tax=Oribacterium sp. P6A1 TaxID=1410612 RepID=UPI00056CCEF2|nr:cobalt-precorrin-5B (C(1))-methyltransferase CbiD [Oribacterium sp. P6A1]